MNLGFMSGLVDMRDPICLQSPLEMFQFSRHLRYDSSLTWAVSWTPVLSPIWWFPWHQLAASPPRFHWDCFSLGGLWTVWKEPIPRPLRWDGFQFVQELPEKILERSFISYIRSIEVQWEGSDVLSFYKFFKCFVFFLTSIDAEWAVMFLAIPDLIISIVCCMLFASWPYLRIIPKFVSVVIGIWCCYIDLNDGLFPRERWNG